MTGLGRAVEVKLEGGGPFLIQHLGRDVSFGIGDGMAVMQVTSATGQVILLPFEKDALQNLGIALTQALKDVLQAEGGEAGPGNPTFGKSERDGS